MILNYKLQEVRILPIIISANGLIDSRLQENLEKLGLIPVKPILAEAQKAVLLGTTRTVRRVLNK